MNTEDARVTESVLTRGFGRGTSVAYLKVIETPSVSPSRLPTAPVIVAWISNIQPGKIQLSDEARHLRIVRKLIDD